MIRDAADDGDKTEYIPNDFSTKCLGGKLHGNSHASAQIPSIKKTHRVVLTEKWFWRNGITRPYSLCPEYFAFGLGIVT